MVVIVTGNSVEPRPAGERIYLSGGLIPNVKGDRDRGENAAVDFFLRDLPHHPPRIIMSQNLPVPPPRLGHPVRAVLTQSQPVPKAVPIVKHHRIAIVD